MSSLTQSFQDRTVLITGGTRGIGLATAQRFVAAGARVVLVYRRDHAQANAAVALLGADKARAVSADVGETAQVQALFEDIAGVEGSLDILVANAAATAFKPLLETGPHNLARTFGITVGGFLGLVQGSVALMANSAGDARPGSIVAVSGFDAARVLARHGTLGAAKAAMETLVRYLAVELAPRGIRVNAVSPGYVETASSRLYAGDAFESTLRPQWESATPLGRLGTPEEIASVITFLASEQAGFVTGQTLLADGGLTLR